MSGCVFCMIVRDESPNYRICEDDKSVAILDLYPVNPGHILVLPKRHVETLAELEEDELTSMTLMLQKLVRAVDKALAPDGLNMMINQGEAAGQVVPHFHWHIIPRYTGDRLVIRSTRLRPSAEEFREVQAWLRENL